ELVGALVSDDKRLNRTSELRLPAASGFAAVGTKTYRLSLSQARVALRGDGVDASGPPPHPTFDFGELKWRLRNAYAQISAAPVRHVDVTPGPAGALERVLRDCGLALTTAFLPDAVAAALSAALDERLRVNARLQVGFDIA